MNGRTDSELLRDYVETGSEAAFGELARRHVNFVFSAARRMVCDTHLAEDVTQAVFVALAKNAAQLIERPVLSGWLHRTAQNIAAQTVRTDVRRRAREQEVAAMNERHTTDSDTAWNQIAPQLDAALNELNAPDRDALLLRYFEGKSAREMAQLLSTTEEAAQRRVSRAVERLRELFTKRGITVGASGLVALLSANAVQSAPAGLSAAVATAGAVSGKTLAVTATKALVMTTLQKTVIAGAVAAAVAVAIYEVQPGSPKPAASAVSVQPAPNDEVSNLRARVQRLDAQNAQLAGALAEANSDRLRLEKEREEAKRAAALYKELADANSKQSNATNDYPTVRHTLQGFGSVARRVAMLKELDEAELTDAEKAANEELRLNLMGDIVQLTKAAKQFGIYRPDSSLPNADNADFAACFLLGALELTEQQFGAVFTTMQKYTQPAVQPPAENDEPTVEAKQTVGRLDEQVRNEIQGILSEEQSKIFSQISSNMQLLNPADGRAAFGYSLGDKDKSDGSDETK
jgi:RNA polymerase sigma factor (sigma-70 family)